jgi:uncharacterized protein (DUF885 family)
VTASAQLQVIAADYWEFRLREFPTVAHEAGDQRYRRDLFRESIADHDRRATAAEGFLQRLCSIAIEALGEQDTYSHRLLERELHSITAHHRLAGHLRPLMFPESPDVSIAFALQRSAIRTRADADDYIDRLATLPAYLEHRRERVLAGVAAGYRLPRALLPRLLASVEGELAAREAESTWARPLARLPADDPRFAPARDRLPLLVTRHLRPAYQRWLELLRDDRLLPRRDTIALRDDPGGEEYYALLTREYTNTNDAPARIHEIGLEEVARIGVEMQSVARRTGHGGDLAALRHHVATDPAFRISSRDVLRERLEVLAKRIDRRVPEFFGRIPRMTYGVESIPESQAAQLPAAYAQPSPPSRLTAGVFWVTSLPERCPTQMHVPLTLHEAWPGHLMHIALLQEMDELPAFRRFGMMGYTAYIEGWALYCEQLGHDLGLYDDPYAHYGQLEMEMWRAVRLVVDTGIHMMGWRRDAAIAYMAQHLTLPGPTIEAEVDRYIGMPAQALAYKIGELRIRALRERAQEALGERFDLRALHDALCGAGPVTLDLLEQHVQSWIDASCREAA